MRNTMGQAQAMSGGYANSYAQSVGQQQYQQYLQQLNDRIPELQQQAYQRYLQDRADLKDQFSMAGQLRNNEYQQYRDTVSDWQQDRSFDQSAYQDQRNFDRNAFNTDRGYWQQEYWNQRNAEHSNSQDANSANWSDTQGQTDTAGWNTSQTNTDSRNWSDTESHTDSWSHSSTDTTGWSNTVGSSWGHSLGEQSGTSTTNSSSSTNSWSDAGSGSGSGSSTLGSLYSPGRDWVIDNDTEVQRSADSNGIASYNGQVNNQETISRNQMERRLSNIGNDKEKQADMIMNWVEQGRISINDATYLADKYKIKF